MSEPIREPEIQKEAELKIISAPESQASMRWHSFLVKYMLRLFAAYHLFQAIWIALGKIYFDSAVRNAVYSGLPGMLVLDYACAVLFVCASAMLIFARKDLSMLNARGISRLKTAYILLIAATGGYALMRFLIAGLSPLSLPVIGQTISYTALLLINRAYYRARSGAFAEDPKKE